MLWHCISFNKLDLENHFGGYVSISWYFKLSIYFKDRLTLRISLKYDHIRYAMPSQIIILLISILFKVDPGGGAGPQYCRLVCTQGAWRGPYCSHSPEHHDTKTRGMQHCRQCTIGNTQTFGLQAKIKKFWSWRLRWVLTVVNTFLTYLHLSHQEY